MAITRKAWTAKARHLLDIFLAGQKDTTRQAYEVDLEAFRKFKNADTPAEAIADLIRKGPGPADDQAKLYRKHLRNNYAAATVNRRLSFLRSLTRSARAQHITNWRLRIADLKVTRSRNTAGPGVEAVKRMIAAAGRPGGYKGPRDEAILYLLFGLGLRRAEVAAIDRCDVRLGDKPPTVEIRAAKGRDQPVRISLGETVVSALHAWIMYRGDHDGPLFTCMSQAHDQTKRLTDSGIYHIVTTIGAAVGIKTSPHGLRHTAITAAVRKKSIGEVQAFSRHANLETIKDYIDHDQDAALDVQTAITEAL